MNDTEILDWIIENCTTSGGGKGFELKVFIPVDSECIRGAILETIKKEKFSTKLPVFLDKYASLSGKLNELSRASSWNEARLPLIQIISTILQG